MRFNANDVERTSFKPVLVFSFCLDLQLPTQSVPIITKAVSSNPVHGEVYSIIW